VWVMRWTLIGIVMLALLGFAMQNAGAVRVAAGSWKSDPLPLYLVAYFAFAVGVIVAALAAAVAQVQQRVQLNRCRKEIVRLKKELNDLRRLSLDETLLDDDDDDSSDAPSGGATRR